jgi:hypothetical protein
LKRKRKRRRMRRRKKKREMGRRKRRPFSAAWPLIDHLKPREKKRMRKKDQTIQRSEPCSAARLREVAVEAEGVEKTEFEDGTEKGEEEEDVKDEDGAEEAAEGREPASRASCNDLLTLDNCSLIFKGR